MTVDEALEYVAASDRNASLDSDALEVLAAEVNRLRDELQAETDHVNQADKNIEMFRFKLDNLRAAAEYYLAHSESPDVDSSFDAAFRAAIEASR